MMREMSHPRGTIREGNGRPGPGKGILLLGQEVQISGARQMKGLDFALPLIRWVLERDLTLQAAGPFLFACF